MQPSNLNKGDWFRLARHAALTGEDTYSDAYQSILAELRGFESK